MAGIFQRMSTIFHAKADKALDRVEDPRETLDYSYQKQLDLLQKVRRGVADVATSRKRVELQANQLNEQVEKLNLQAQRALEQNREDLAREALTRKSGLQQQLGDLQDGDGGIELALAAVGKGDGDHVGGLQCPAKNQGAEAPCGAFGRVGRFSGRLW